MLRIYLAGPMTGIPQFNYPAFDAAAYELRKRGYFVVSPAELDSAEDDAAARASSDGSPTSVGHSWGWYVSRAVRVLADGVGDPPEPLDGIVLLPGWEGSNGARLEAFIGLLRNKSFGTYDPKTRQVTLRAQGWVKSEIARDWHGY